MSRPSSGCGAWTSTACTAKDARPRPGPGMTNPPLRRLRTRLHRQSSLQNVDATTSSPRSPPPPPPRVRPSLRRRRDPFSASARLASCCPARRRRCGRPSAPRRGRTRARAHRLRERGLRGARAGPVSLARAAHRGQTLAPGRRRGRGRGDPARRRGAEPGPRPGRRFERRRGPRARARLGVAREAASGKKGRPKKQKRRTKQNRSAGGVGGRVPSTTGTAPSARFEPPRRDARKRVRARGARALRQDGTRGGTRVRAQDSTTNSRGWAPPRTAWSPSGRPPGSLKPQRIRETTRETI